MPKKKKESISNPGSALGEAIGVLIESALNKELKAIAESSSCIFIPTGPENPKTKKSTKLLLIDANGIEYNIDSVIVNARMQPLILIESKYIRYKKHNRDKGSWVCTAHQSLRKRFSSIRSSVAILAGSWSKTSKAMMRSFDITLFDIPFETICDTLRGFEIDFEWGEKDRKKAYRAWRVYAKLSDPKKLRIGEVLINSIKTDLASTISQVLNNASPRTIKRVEIEITSNLGEAKIYSFDSATVAFKFLQKLNVAEILNTEGAPTLFDNTTGVTVIEDDDAE